MKMEWGWNDENTLVFLLLLLLIAFGLAMGVTRRHLTAKPKKSVMREEGYKGKREIKDKEGRKPWEVTWEREEDFRERMGMDNEQRERERGLRDTGGKKGMIRKEGLRLKESEWKAWPFMASSVVGLKFNLFIVFILVEKREAWMHPFERQGLRYGIGCGGHLLQPLRSSLFDVLDL